MSSLSTCGPISSKVLPIGYLLFCSKSWLSLTGYNNNVCYLSIWSEQLRDNLAGCIKAWSLQGCHQNEGPESVVSQFFMERVASEHTLCAVHKVFSLRDSHPWLHSPLTAIPKLPTAPGGLSHQDHARRDSKRKIQNHRINNLLGYICHFTVFH